MTEYADGPGATLRAAREGLDVGVREIADALNLPIHVVECLEANDYEGLPPTVFTRGYLRSYARLLELSPEELIDLYPSLDFAYRGGHVVAAGTADRKKT